MFVSSFSIAILTLEAILQQEPWCAQRYAILILGMLLGNTMPGVALALDRMTSLFFEQREVVEQRLMLGDTWREAVSELRSACMRTGMIPVINAMVAAGLVSLPGTMTGSDDRSFTAGLSSEISGPYHVLIAAGTGGGIVSSILMIERRLFDSGHRLCLHRLSNNE